MDKESIIREWFYRLPKGYAEPPYTKTEMNTLHAVLEENGMNGSVFVNETVDIELKEVDILDQGFLEAEPVKELRWAPLEELEEVLNEAPFQGWEQLQSIQEKVSAADKQREWDEFRSVIDASGAKPAAATAKVLNGLSEEEQKEFVQKLRSFTAIQTGKSERITGPLAIKLFNIDAKGIGKGEIYICWLYANSSVQGGAESFDIQISDRKYEIKDYSGTGFTKKGEPKEKTGAIRVGVEGSVSKFPVWGHILETVAIIKKMESGKSWNMLPGATKDHPKHKQWNEVIKIKDYINNRLSYEYLSGKKAGQPKSGKIVTGEFSGEDTKKFKQLYETLNNMESIQKSAGKELKVKVQSASYKARPETIINYWKRIPYLSSTYGSEGSPKRAPEQFGADLQQAVIEIIESGPADYWMVFRGSENNIEMKTISRARASEFTYYSISQNGVKFKEPDSSGTGEAPIEAGE